MGASERLLAALERRETWVWVVVGFVLVPILGFVDFLTGYELSLSLAYLIPVTLVAWFGGRGYGSVAAAACAAVWLTAEHSAGRVYSHPVIPLWNTVFRFGLLFVVASLLAALRSVLVRERTLARTDPLTGCLNGRQFLAVGRAEIARSFRYGRPVSLARLDLDGFKAVNDTFGHDVGDQVLKAVVDALSSEIRSSDVLGRLGGDEFAVLLPETQLEAAESVARKLGSTIRTTMSGRGWPVTCSIGVASAGAAEADLDALLLRADELMYEVKRAGKDGVRGAVIAG